MHQLYAHIQAHGEMCVCSVSIFSTQAQIHFSSLQCRQNDTPNAASQIIKLLWAVHGHAYVNSIITIPARLANQYANQFVSEWDKN